MIDTAALHARIADRAADFVRELFGERAKHSGASWRAGKHGSLAIEVKDGCLCFCDHEAGAGGDAVALWRRERGGTNGEALRACAAWAGLSDDGPPAAQQPRPAPTKAARVEIPQIPEHAFNAWREGRERLSGNVAALRELAAWRTWPLPYAEILSRAGIIGAPLCFGERARIAFQVATPEPWPLGADYSPENAHRDRARFVGFHARFKDRDGQHRGWRYLPARDKEPAANGGPALRTTRHPGLPPLPLVLSGPGAFLDAYRFCWPHDAAALVLRDSDKAGTKWTAAGEFLDKLRARWVCVESCHFGTNADGSRLDVNEFYATRGLTRGLFDALLSRLGTSLAEAESTTPPPA